MKPACIYCGEPVFVSKKANTEMQLHPVTGEKGLWRAHNTCWDEARETAGFWRLVDACDGDVEQARLVRGVLLQAPGSLATRRIR